jgi:hypothetical protein
MKMWKCGCSEILSDNNLVRQVITEFCVYVIFTGVSSNKHIDARKGKLVAIYICYLSYLVY